MQKARKYNSGEKKRLRSDTNNTIICTKGHCNHMPYSQEGSGQEVEKKNRKKQEIEHLC